MLLSGWANRSERHLTSLRRWAWTPDDPRAAGGVGRVGMAIDSLRDFEIAFEGVDMHRVGTGLTINAVASIMMAMCKPWLRSTASRS